MHESKLVSIITVYAAGWRARQYMLDHAPHVQLPILCYHLRKQTALLTQ